MPPRSPDVRGPTPWKRFSALSSLLLHLLVVGVAPLAEARLEASSSAHLPVHVEDERAPACDPGHEHRYCILFRTLQSVGGLSGEPAFFLPFVGGRPAPALPPRAAPPSLATLSPLGPRGPPQA